ncbi:PhnE/PtxC family ABC transporter permease [Nocardioides donggukensis]|uniref:ABC transporter permease subunit n=1 Tax=Nocardioides donggukensis TaxID=2774019 RepID=A0A927Q0V2_9ACTN|nr:ABC transporter permease subunit [Nocardioides donggukensis]MBD8871065.1 ABC transporter permease subunit [Nocardioides donggukensis]
MSTALDRPAAPGSPRPTARPRVTARVVLARRLLAVAIVVLPVLWALHRSFSGGTAVVNTGGLRLLADLGASVLDPALAPDFLARVADAALVTVVFAALGTAGALVIGAAGGLVLSDIAWSRRPAPWLRGVRLVLRGALVAIRSIHEVIWALLFVSVLGLDPLVAVLAIALPFGAQTAKVFSETLDGVPHGSLLALRHAGARPGPALAYGLLPGATPLLLSYSFYRFECAIRSAVLLGVVGIGGLGQELVVSLQSRNWDEVWTLIGAVLVLSALVDAWSSRIRADVSVASCSDWSAGDAARATRPSPWARWSLALLPLVLVASWIASGVSLAGLTSARTRDLTVSLLEDMLPPELPPGGVPELSGAVLDTVAMAVLAMVLAVGITLLVAPWATRPWSTRGGTGPAGGGVAAGAVRRVLWIGSRLLLLVLRSVPPPVWAVVALLALFPGVLPGAVALGLYTGGILGRLVAEAWESLDRRSLEALLHAGVRRPVAAAAALTPASTHHLVTFTLYRFEICVRDTAVVGVVGAAGLGRLLTENLVAFRFPVVATVLVASFGVSLASEVLGRRLRAALRGTQAAPRAG